MTAPASTLATVDDDALVMPRFLHVPDHAVSIGGEVADLVSLFGRTPNPEQRLLLDGAFAFDKRGRPAAFDVVVVAGRQNLKTGFMLFRALGKALLLERPLQVWTAHKETATDGALTDLRAMVEASSELSRRVKRFTEGKGSKSVEFVNGCEIVFRPRTATGGQAMSAEDVDFDEDFATTAAHLASYVPTMATRIGAQIGRFSSAPHPGSVELRKAMERGRAAAEGRVPAPRLLYAEWSSQVEIARTSAGRVLYGPPPCQDPECTHVAGQVEGCIADDREVIKAASPSAGRSSAPAIEWEFIAEERTTLPVAEFLRERCGVGVEDQGDDGDLFDDVAWADLHDPADPPKVTALGMALSADRRTFAIAAAGQRPDGRVHLGAVDQTRQIRAAAQLLARAQETYGCEILVDSRGPAADLLDKIREGAPGLRFRELVLDDVVESASWLYDAARAHEITHHHHPELDADVKVAAWRDVGDGRRVLGRRKSAASIAMLEAASFAGWSASGLDYDPLDSLG